MIRILLLLATLIAIIPKANASIPIGGATCTGRFPNPITDVCWACIFPIKIGELPVVPSDKPDLPGSPNPICTCPIPYPPYQRIGLRVSFWEPTRLVDVTRTPGCMVNLGGGTLNLGSIMPTQGDLPRGDEGDAFFHAHWYIFPLINLINLITDVACKETQGFDLAYMTELDPLWHNDELTFLLNPEAVIFNNPVAITACAADCVAATAGLPLDPMFWCLGCSGTAYPMDGRIDSYHGGISASLNLLEKMTYKLHRQGQLWGSLGDQGLCGTYPMPIMRKSQYRSQLTYPIPTTTSYFCCNPYGRSTALYEEAKEFPVAGEHFGWLVWRKRNCCVSAW
ncbi:conjugal transfer pilus assembly protein TraU [Enterovibrio paralichthyis]|uniref:conjugal transfer pilus assembly protein TraU n=1 Tax=Enterovibrio paralichthyis TaxID=2853805 RepID=UPI001C4522E5|nr:conjugal transfer pilus assembly protein TraU [Enterovibrio paralichthyis]MBV7300277.1 TraU family protein [Enterovibrio paralichthyis]